MISQLLTQRTQLLRLSVSDETNCYFQKMNRLRFVVSEIFVGLAVDEEN